MNPSAAPPVESGQNLAKIISASSAGTLMIKENRNVKMQDEH